MLTTPTPGSQFTGTTVTFEWTAGAGSSAYWLDLGSRRAATSTHQSGNLGNVLTITANGLPSDGSTVYATLYSLVGGQWLSTGYTYTAYNGSSAGKGATTSPANNSPLSGNQVTFTWNPAASATAYWVDDQRCECGWKRPGSVRQPGQCDQLHDL